MFHYVKYLIKKEKIQKISDNTVIVAQICFSYVILVKEFSVCGWFLFFSCCISVWVKKLFLSIIPDGFHSLTADGVCVCVWKQLKNKKNLEKVGYFVKREQEEMRGGSNGVKWREVEDAGNRADEEAALCVPSLMPNLAHEGAVMRIGNRTRFIVLTCLIKQLSGCFERGVCQDVTRWGPSVFLFVCFFKTTPTTSASPTPSPQTENACFHPRRGHTKNTHLPRAQTTASHQLWG